MRRQALVLGSGWCERRVPVFSWPFRSLPATNNLLPKRHKRSSFVVPSQHNVPCFRNASTTAREASPAHPVASEQRKGSEKHPTTTNEESSSLSSSVDPEEIRRLSDNPQMQWWNPEGHMKPLHRMNPKRVAYIRLCLSKHHVHNPLSPVPLKGLNIVDVGCGVGLLSESLARLGGNVLGVDASAPNIETAQRHAEGDPLLSTLNYRHTTAEQLVQEQKQFDAVCCMEVIEHVNQPDVFLKTLCDLVKPGGSLFLSTINRTMKSYALAILGAEYILGWVPKGTHTWSKFVQPTELAVLLRRHNFTLHEVTGMAYDPLIGQWSVSQDTSVNYLLWASKPSEADEEIRSEGASEHS
ncbi:Hexaprenyldihydroxybenzoate methyltransferase, mitochondrial [Balamuthia mandrillaris]